MRAELWRSFKRSVVRMIRMAPKLIPEVRAVWNDCCENHNGGTRDPRKCDDDILRAFTELYRLRIEGGALRIDLWEQTETQEAKVELSEHGPEDADHETHETHEPEVEESEHGREDVEQETQEPERGGRGAVELA